MSHVIIDIKSKRMSVHIFSSPYSINISTIYYLYIYLIRDNINAIFNCKIGNSKLNIIYIDNINSNNNNTLFLMIILILEYVLTSSNSSLNDIVNDITMVTYNDLDDYNYKLIHLFLHKWYYTEHTHCCFIANLVIRDLSYLFKKELYKINDHFDNFLIQVIVKIICITI